MPAIGPYEVLDELGRGGMGVVYRARHVPTGAIRALKVLDGAPDPEALERFRREGQALARVAGAGVVPVHESGTAGRRLYLVMDFMAGGSLRARLARDGRLPWREAAALAAKVAGTLARCHAAGLVHRDLKPDNVLLDERGEPRLADFGAVRDLGASALTLSGTSLGTPLYMAPEQLMGERVGPSADVWALGVLLHELVAGQRPFAGSTPLQLLEAARQGERASLEKSGAPPALEALVARALEPVAARRPAASELSADLGALLTSERAVSSRGRGRSPVRWALPGLAACGLAVGLVATLASRSPGPGPIEPARPSPPVSPRPSAAPSQAATASVDTRSPSRRAADAASLAAVRDYLELLRTLPVDLQVTAPREQLKADSRRADRALFELKDDAPERAAALEACGDLAWELARRRRGEKRFGLDADIVARASRLHELVDPVRPPVPWMQAGFLALELGNPEFAGHQAVELARAVEAPVRKTHPAEAAWLQAVEAYDVIARAARDSAFGLELDQLAVRALATLATLGAPAGAPDPILLEARVLFLEIRARLEWFRAVREDGAPPLVHFLEAQRLTRSALELGVVTRRNSEHLLLAFLDASVLRSDYEGGILSRKLTGRERSVLLEELDAQSKGLRLGLEPAPQAPVIALVRRLWAIVDPAVSHEEVPLILSLVREDARELSRSPDPQVAIQAVAIELMCLLELGQAETARSLERGHDPELRGAGWLLLGTLTPHFLDRVAAAGQKSR